MGDRENGGLSIKRRGLMLVLSSPSGAGKTSISREVLGQEDNLGTIAQGRIADIIAVPRNPLDDIATLHDVDFVMKDGVVFRDDRA